MKFTSLVLSTLMLGQMAFAQNAHKCASHEYLKLQDALNPGLEQQIKNLAQFQYKKTRATVVYIPVVFHVVYKNAAENLTDNYIDAQIDQLNMCYGRTNSDTTNMRSVFQPIVGKAKIQFILDKIVRVSTTQTSFDAGGIAPFSGSDQVKFTANGGSDAQMPTQKLNVWSCDLKLNGSDGLIGYAYPPPGLPNWGGQGNTNPTIDGVVMDYLDIGGPLKQPKGYAYGFRGKSLVHEVGHYLGLRHIWGDDGGACFGQMDYEDDGITDTPDQADQSPDNCDKVINSCTQTPDMPDMVENYMDYSSSNCQNSFTKGQVTLMENVLATIRTTVKVPTSIVDVDAPEQVIVYPNPAMEIVNMAITGFTSDKGVITISNSLGQVVKQLNVNKSNDIQSISVADLSKGLYIIQLSVDHKNLFTQKLKLQ